MRFLKPLSTAALLVMVVGCGQQQSAPCPEAGQDFLEKSIRAYFDRFPPKGGGEGVRILSDATYNPAHRLWSVSVDVPDNKYYAMVSCNGHTELSSRALSETSR
ncbi:hypothetical protein NJC40_15960 [Pseudomonas sp. 21LCFQ02]|uniref:hypothetical protein n=1 Tax=unclassified Pseudomonas TaxID=196821 RepID=UPI00209B1268|nr:MULTISPECIES: hypothetical protein [unclassified Pseudomonas]MCO8169267.1 hypothetical protein [Pseudomonas sp. 21LCFQ02]MCQ9424070.1 hypothetical protein [Pseudomonas sp. LJDD11]